MFSIFSIICKLFFRRRYIKDVERTDMHKQSLSLTIQIMKDIFKKNSDKRNNPELLQLMIDIYKGYKKVLKQTNQKETAFTSLLVEVYKFYIGDKVEKLPENCNYLDYSIKLCLQEIQHRKNLEKQGITNLHPSQIPPASSDFGGILKNLPSAATSAVTLPTIPQQITASAKSQQSGQLSSAGNLSQQPPVKKSRTSTGKPSTSAANPIPTPNLSSLMDPSALMMALCSNPALFQSQYQTLATEYFKLMTAAGMKNVFSSSAPSTPSPKPVTTTASSTFATSTSSASSAAAAAAAKIPQFDIKSLIESAVAKPPTSASPLQSTTINIGGGELTITPTLSKPSTPKETPPPKPLSKPVSSSSPQSVSVTKIPGNSPSISVKPLSELSAKPAPMPQLPDLPKSLSITPAPSASSSLKQSSKPHISVVPELGKIQKPNPPTSSKSKSKSKSNFSNPYMRTPPTSSASPYALLGAGGFNLDNYASQAAALTAYAEYIQNSGLNPAALELAKLQMHQMMVQPPVQKKQAPKKPPKPKMPMIPTSSVSRAPTTFIPPINMMGQGLPNASLASMLLSQTMAGMSSPATTSTPSPNLTGALQVSPTKTLQQKLAEKQKANSNQFFDRPGSAGSSGSSGSGQRKNSDVIILD